MPSPLGRVIELLRFILYWLDIIYHWFSKCTLFSALVLDRQDLKISGLLPVGRDQKALKERHSQGVLLESNHISWLFLDVWAPNPLFWISPDTLLT